MGSGSHLRLVAVFLVSGALLSGCVLIPFVGAPSTDAVGQDELDPSADQPAGNGSIGECPWAFPTATATPTMPTGSVDDRAATEALALGEDEFWMLVDSIPQNPSEADFLAAASALAGCGLPAVASFDARLALALSDLDGPENLAWFEDHDPLGLGFVSGDVFLYARCATVLAGRDVWTRAVEERTLEWSDDTLHESGMSELLLYITWDAAGAHGLSVDELFELTSGTRISYESGSNVERWD